MLIAFFQREHLLLNLQDKRITDSQGDKQSVLQEKIPFELAHIIGQSVRQNLYTQQ